jgi:tetratricopeptide (TPR) repeat protein
MHQLLRVLGSVLVWMVTINAIAATSPKLENDAEQLSRSLIAAERQYGPLAPELVPILSPLAQLRFEQAELAEAAALRRRALKVAIAAYGGGSAPAAEAMAALAHLYVENHRYLDAEPLTIIATKILRDRRGEPNSALTAVLADRARIALANGDNNGARRWAKAAIEIDRKYLGRPQSDRLRVLGTLLAAQESFDESERAFDDALALDRGRGDDLAAARTLAGLANTELRRKRYSKALPSIEETILIDQRLLAPNHPLIAEDFHNLGLVYLALDRSGDAAKALGWATDIMMRGAGRDTPTLAYIELDFARAEHALGHEDQAKSLFINAQHILNAAEDEERERQRRI